MSTDLLSAQAWSWSWVGDLVSADSCPGGEQSHWHRKAHARACCLVPGLEHGENPPVRCQFAGCGLASARTLLKWWLLPTNGLAESMSSMISNNTLPSSTLSVKERNVNPQIIEPTHQSSTTEDTERLLANKFGICWRITLPTRIIFQHMLDVVPLTFTMSAHTETYTSLLIIIKTS